MKNMNLKAKLSFINDILKNNRVFVLISSIYLIIGLLLLFYNSHTYNFDSLSYINIAQDYFQGHYAEAINAYWGPLFSWILIPFLYIFGNDPLQSFFAAKVLSLILGLIALIGFKLLLNRFEINEKIGNILLLSLVPELVYFSFIWITPDLLITCILMFYLVLILSHYIPIKLHLQYYVGY
jgi:hypothetical protein